jgi:hypothetical protein
VGTSLKEIPILRNWRRYGFDRLNQRIEKVFEPYTHTTGHFHFAYGKLPHFRPAFIVNALILSEERMLKFAVGAQKPKCLVACPILFKWRKSLRRIRVLSQIVLRMQLYLQL